jgi:transcriptional regulator with XRE-family HTH domain
MNFSEIVQLRIRELRKLQGMTQEDLAAAVGVNRVIVARWETGNGMPSPENMDKIAAALKVPVWYLCTPAHKTQTDIEECFLRVMDYTKDKILQDLQRLGKPSRLNVTPVANTPKPTKDAG